MVSLSQSHRYIYLCRQITPTTPTRLVCSHVATGSGAARRFSPALARVRCLVVRRPRCAASHWRRKPTLRQISNELVPRRKSLRFRLLTSGPWPNPDTHHLVEILLPVTDNNGAFPGDDVCAGSTRLGPCPNSTLGTYGASSLRKNLELDHDSRFWSWISAVGLSFAGVLRFECSRPRRPAVWECGSGYRRSD